MFFASQIELSQTVSLGYLNKTAPTIKEKTSGNN